MVDKKLMPFLRNFPKLYNGNNIFILLLTALSEHKLLHQSIAEATAQGFDPALEYAGDDATTNSTVESISSKSILNNRTLKTQQALLKELAKLFSIFGLEIPHSLRQLPGLQPDIASSVDGTAVVS